METHRDLGAIFRSPSGERKGDNHRPSSTLSVILHVTYAWNGLGEYAATKLRKGDHIYVEGTLVSSTFEKEFGKGQSKIAVPLDSIRKLNRVKKEQVSESAPVEAPP